MNVLRHTWFMTVRQARNLMREPIWIVLLLVQPMVWLVLYGQLFRNVTKLGGFGTGSYITFLAPAIVVMLASLGVEPIADWVLHQSERWDGAGYPEGLSGDAIPLGSRIVFVADAFDSMTSTRPYRPALRRAEALIELERCSGSQFDPDVVDAFLETVEPQPLATA